MALIALGGLWGVGALPDGWAAGPISIEDVTAFLFVTSALAVHEFRQHMIAASAVWHRFAQVAFVGLAVAGAIAPLGTAWKTTTAGMLVGLAMIVFWTVCMGDTARAFHRAAARHDGAVRVRLRALSIGLGALVALVLFSASGVSPDLTRRTVIAVIALMLLPVIIVGTAMPRRVVGWWRTPQAVIATTALHELIGESADLASLTHVGVSWGRRLVGGDAAVLIDDDGTVVAADVVGTVDDLTRAEIGNALARRWQSRRDRLRNVGAGVAETTLGEDGPSMVTTPIPGAGMTLVVATTRLASVYDPDETVHLAAFGKSLAAGVAQARLIRQLQRQSEELEQLVALKETVLGTVGHDLRNPLAALRGLVDVMSRLDDSMDGDERHDMLDRMAGNAHRMEDLLRDLVDGTGFDPSPTVHEPVDLLTLTRDTVAKTTAGRRISVRGETVHARVDATLVGRAIENLVRNALRHTHGTIDVVISRWGEEALIRVDDRGPGVPANERERIFQPGVRVGIDANGHGIGLYLVARIADHHKGRTWVEERPEGGASFRIALPIGVDGDGVGAAERHSTAPV